MINNDLFNFVIIAFSFVYTAAALRLLGGISAASNHASRYIVHLLLIAVVLLSIVISFWGNWAYRDIDWKLYQFILALIDGALYYFIATVLIPENPEKIPSWKSYYFENKNKFFYGMLVFLFYVQIHSFVLIGQDLIHPARFANCIAFVPIYFGIRNNTHKVHLGIAIFYLIFTIAMVFTVASKPGWVANLK